MIGLTEPRREGWLRDPKGQAGICLGRGIEMGVKGTPYRGASQEKPRGREKRIACRPWAAAGKHGGSVLPTRDSWVSRDVDLRPGTGVASGDYSDCL